MLWDKIRLDLLFIMHIICEYCLENKIVAIDFL